VKPSGSKLALLPLCAYYARPDVPWLEDTPGMPARFGNAVHSLCEGYVVGKLLGVQEAAIQHGVPESEWPRLMRVWAVALRWLGANVRVGWQAELALAYDWDASTARVLPSEGHRDYSQATWSELCGTADIATMDGQVAVVYDWKTGETPLASYEAQASFLALAWARATGATSARAVFVHFGEESADAHVWEFDAMGLDAVESGITDGMVLAINEAPPQPGPHCSDMYCPARASCPATTAVMLSNPDVAPLAELVATAIQTPEQAGAAYRKLRLVKDAVKLVEERIRSVVEEQGEAPTVPGKALRLVTTTRETFSQGRIPPERREAVLADLRELGAVQSSTSSYLKEGAAKR
jgi:hypothetical protein